MNAIEELGVGIHEFLLGTPERFGVHPTLHLGKSTICIERRERDELDASQVGERSTAWLSILRPSCYCEIYVRARGDRPPEAEMHFYAYTVFGKGKGRKDTFTYDVGRLNCRCEACELSYPEPFVWTNCLEEVWVDLTVPDSLVTIRREVCTCRWHFPWK